MESSQIIQAESYVLITNHLDTCLAYALLLLFQTEEAYSMSFMVL